ncbi:MAG: hypothetical protein ABI651_21975 [Verrucomicrobiota bacterium]
MESRNPKLQRSDMEMNMPPRWGFSSSGIGVYNDVAPLELENGSSVAARTTVLIQRQRAGARASLSSYCMVTAKA